MTVSWSLSRIGSGSGPHSSQGTQTEDFVWSTCPFIAEVQVSPLVEVANLLRP